ncbi:beta strand repeat-containing protein [Haloferula sp. A504]|uniref:beta strand repeat-containing protein n=1 Tax=Haloferula sp. A504 TaxID=3373601 RepID=UPI0031C3C139|nr:autotransporter adhesin family protein [Verrucomicrobiaceae bacterium E54]
MKPMNIGHLLPFSLVASCLVTVLHAQEASTTEWNAGAAGNWADSTWSSGVPTTGSLAGILNGDTVTVAAPAADDLSQILIDGTSTLAVDSTIGIDGTDSPATGLYVLDGTLNVNSGGNLDVSTGGRFWIGLNKVGTLALGPSGIITTDRPVAIGREGGGSGTAFNQTGGSLTTTTNEFRVGAFDAVGAYNLSGGTAVINTMKVGYAGSGTGNVTISGGSTDLTLNGETSIAWDANSNGLLTVENGTVVTNDRIRVGVAGTTPASGTRTATLNQTGGSLTVNGRIDIGGNTPADVVNTVSISGGTLATTQSVNVGYAGTATGILNASGNAQFNPENIIVSNGAETTGTVNLIGVSTTTVAGEITVGPNSAATSTAEFNLGEFAYLQTDNLRIRNGSFSQSGDSELNLLGGGGGFLLGVDSTGDSTYNLSSGIINSGDRIRVGVTPGGATLFNQTGGDVNITGRLDIADNAGASNVYQISAGTLDTTGNALVGAFTAGGATLSVSGTGVATIGGNIEVGRASTTGVVDVSSGSLSGNTLILGQDKVGGDALGQGTLNLSGTGLLSASSLQVRKGIANQMDSTSTFNVSGDAIIGLNNQADATYNMDGGNLNVIGRLRLGAGSGAVVNLFNQTGGTVDLKNRLDFGDADTATNRYSISGGTLSLTGGDQRILVGFQDNTSGQLDVSGTGLVQASSVVLGEFSLATGTVNLSGGVVETTQIKSGNAPGSSQTLNLNGGTIRSAADASVNIDGNLPANLLAGGITFDVPDGAWTTTTSGIMTGVGGLTKIGPGKLIVNGVQQYTGDTTVQAGTLCLAEPYLDAGSDLYLTTGAVLDLDYAGTSTIGTLYIDGVPQPAGVYDSASALITGTGSLTSTIGGTPDPLTIESFSRTGTTATIVIKGAPNTDYVCKSSTDLSGFGTTEGTETTDGSGNATFTVDATGTRKFYIVEDAP